MTIVVLCVYVFSTDWLSGENNLPPVCQLFGMQALSNYLKTTL